MNLSRQSKDKYLAKLALLKDESSPTQFSVVWDAFYEANEDDQLMASMSYLDQLDEAGDEDPILFHIDEADDPLLAPDEEEMPIPAPSAIFGGLPAPPKKVAGILQSESTDDGLTDTESEDNNSEGTESEAPIDDLGEKKPRAKPTATRVNPTRVQPAIKKAPRNVPPRQGKRLPTKRNRSQRDNEVYTQQDIDKRQQDYVRRIRALEFSQEIHNDIQLPLLRICISYPRYSQSSRGRPYP